MAANDPIVEKIIIDCKKIMQFYCGTYNPLFKIGASDIKIDTPDVKIDGENKFFFLGNHILLGSKSSRDYLITAKSEQSDIITPNIVTIEKGKFLITTFDHRNYHFLKSTMSTTKIIDAPLVIAVKMNDQYNFVGLAIVGAENKIGVFSIIESLSNDALKKKLLDAIKESSHMLCFQDENNFFSDGKFKPGISTNERGHTAAEISRLKKEISVLDENIRQLAWEEEIRLYEKPHPSKEQQIKAQEKMNTIKEAQVKAKERVNDIEEALKQNSPEKLHLLLEKDSSSCLTFFTYLGLKKKKSKLPENILYRSLSDTSPSMGTPKF
jgi:hypothetical protein